jgi:hypothetical protein
MRVKIYEPLESPEGFFNEGINFLTVYRLGNPVLVAQHLMLAGDNAILNYSSEGDSDFQAICGSSPLLASVQAFSSKPSWIYLCPFFRKGIPRCVNGSFLTIEMGGKNILAFDLMTNLKKTYSDKDFNDFIAAKVRECRLLVDF